MWHWGTVAPTPCFLYSTSSALWLFTCFGDVTPASGMLRGIASLSIGSSTVKQFWDTSYVRDSMMLDTDSLAFIDQAGNLVESEELSGHAVANISSSSNLYTERVPLADFIQATLVRSTAREWRNAVIRRDTLFLVIQAWAGWTFPQGLRTTSEDLPATHTTVWQQLELRTTLHLVYHHFWTWKIYSDYLIDTEWRTIRLISRYTQQLVHNVFMAWKQDDEQLWAVFLTMFRDHWRKTSPRTILTWHVAYATIKAWKFYMVHFPSHDMARNLHMLLHPKSMRGFRAFADRTNDTRILATEALCNFQTPYSRRTGLFAREKAFRWLVFAEWLALLGSDDSDAPIQIDDIVVDVNSRPVTEDWLGPYQF